MNEKIEVEVVQSFTVAELRGGIYKIGDEFCGTTISARDLIAKKLGISNGEKPKRKRGRSKKVLAEESQETKE